MIVFTRKRSLNDYAFCVMEYISFLSKAVSFPFEKKVESGYIIIRWGSINHSKKEETG